jgi:hypothetical protein
MPPLLRPNFGLLCILEPVFFRKIALVDIITGSRTNTVADAIVSIFCRIFVK